MSDGQQKRQLYIVGGKGKNVPGWLSAAFDYEQFDQDHAKTRTLEPTKTPDAVVVLSSWIGHEHFYGARDLAERLKIPMILSPGGWSSSLKAAADLGVEWYIQDVERARSSGDLAEPEVETVEVFIDNAWREAYNREWTAREALERRYGKERANYEHAHNELYRMREGEKARLKKMDDVARRVVNEIRTAAARQREKLELHNKEIQKRSERVARALAVHLSSLEELFDVADEAHSSIIGTSAKLRTARKITKQKIDILNAALQIAEAETTHEPEFESKEIESEAPVASSNLNSDQ